MCVRAFTRADPGAELDACLWSLTEALKTLMKGASQGKIHTGFLTLFSRYHEIRKNLLTRRLTGSSRHVCTNSETKCAVLTVLKLEAWNK